MRTVIVTFDSPENVGGVEGRATAYTRELQAQGHAVIAAAFARTYHPSTAPFEGSLLHRFPSGPGHLLPSLFRFQRLVRGFSADSIFLLSGGITAFGALTLAYCRISRHRSAILYYGKDVLEARRSASGQLLLGLSQLLADRIVANSRYTASLVPRSLRKKTDVLYPSVNPREAEGLTVDGGRIGQRVLFVGRLVKRKGAEDLIEAFRSVADNHPALVLEIVGDGPERRSLERQVADLNLGGRVRFYGTLRGQALYERYALCDVFAMPSRTLESDVEGFGTVFLEAGLFGKPAIGTFSGGIPEAIQNGVTGILVGEGNVPQIAYAIETLLTQKILANNMGEASRKRVLEDFTWAKGTTRLVSILSRPNADQN